MWLEVTLASELETKMFFNENLLNHWLSDNPDTEVVDIKLTANGAYPIILVVYVKNS